MLESELTNIVTTVLLCLPRLVGFYQSAPFMASSVTAGMLRTCIAVAFMPIIVPMVIPHLPEEVFTDTSALTNLWMAALVIKELLLGYFLGFLVGLMFWAVQSAGFVIDNQRGAAIAEIVDPLSKDSTSPLGTFMFQAVVVIFFMLGGFNTVMQAMITTYQVWPITELMPVPIDQRLTLYFIRQMAAMFAIMLLVSAPMVVVAFLVDFSLGMISRFAPQLDVFSLSMPIKSVAVLVILLPFFGLMTTYLADVAIGFPLLIERFGQVGLMDLFNSPR